MVCAVKNKHVWNNTEMDGILGCTNSVAISVCSGNKAGESVLVFIQHCVSYCSMPAGKEKPTHSTPDVPKYTFRINSQDRLMYWFFSFPLKCVCEECLCGAAHNQTGRRMTAHIVLIITWQCGDLWAAASSSVHSAAAPPKDTHFSSC